MQNQSQKQQIDNQPGLNSQTELQKQSTNQIRNEELELELIGSKIQNQNLSPQLDSINGYSTNEEISLKSESNIDGINENQALASLIKAGLGTGMLFTPLIVKECGILIASSFLIILPILIYLSYTLLLCVLDQFQDKSLTILGAIDMIYSPNEQQNAKQ